MKECEKLRIQNSEERKARMEKRNPLIKNKRNKYPDSSLLDVCLDFSPSSATESVSDFASLHRFSRRKPSEIIFAHADSIPSEKDEKILRLMARRREAKMEEEELASAAKNHWEEEKARAFERMIERKKWSMEFLARKKLVEKSEDFVRRNEIEERATRDRTALESRIRDKFERAENEQKRIRLEKMAKLETSTAEYRMRFRRELKRQKDEEEEREKLSRLKSIEAKEKKSRENLEGISAEKRTKRKEESRKRETKWREAKNCRDESNARRELETIRNSTRSKINEILAERKLEMARESRKNVAAEKNLAEKRRRDLAIARLREKEKERLEETKRKIQAKDSRWKRFREKREAAISASRKNARIVADLRQKIRSSYHL